MVAMGVLNRELTEVADVVVSLGHPDLKAAVAGDGEGVAGAGLQPGIGAGELVFAAAGHAFHDLSRAGVEGERGGQHHPDRLFGAVGIGDAVADAFAIEVHAGLGVDGDAADLGGAHG